MYNWTHVCTRLSTYKQKHVHTTPPLRHAVAALADIIVTHPRPHRVTAHSPKHLIVPLVQLHSLWWGAFNLLGANLLPVG